MRRIKKLVAYVCVILIVGLGAYVAYDIINKRQNEPHIVQVFTDDESVSNRLMLETAIVEGFQTKKELITMEVDMSEIIEWDDSWGTFDIFHKSQRIQFYGTGLYITNLDIVTKNDIKVDTERKTVTVSVPKPEIKTVTINEEQTSYEDVDKGWLRFGEIKLTPEQYNAVYEIVKENMLRQMRDIDLYEQAENSTQTNVSDIFRQIVDSVEKGYTVNVEWKDVINNNTEQVE